MAEDVRVVLDLATGETTTVPLSAEEVAQRETDATAAADAETARAAEWAQVKAAWALSGDATKTTLERFNALRFVVRALFRALEQQNGGGP